MLAQRKKIKIFFSWLAYFYLRTIHQYPATPYSVGTGTGTGTGTELNGLMNYAHGVCFSFTVVNKISFSRLHSGENKHISTYIIVVSLMTKTISHSRLI